MSGAPQTASRRVLVLAAAAGLLAIAIALGAALTADREGGRRAVVVDQLSEQYPNEAFVASASDTLESAGYGVDYVPAAAVTVDLYRRLPEYDLVLLRAHAGRLQDDPERESDVSLFTTEPYDESRYFYDQSLGLLAKAFYEEGGPLFFGIPPEFVRFGMRGRFDGATVVLMGCDTLRAPDMAQAFIERGAEMVVGWDGPVSAKHTDLATAALVEYLIGDELPASEAVSRAMAAVGRDPDYRSGLLLDVAGNARR